MDATETTPWEQAYSIAVLKEEIRVLPELTLCYRLCGCYFAQPQFYAEIRAGEQRSAAWLGPELTCARRTFEVLVGATVTPCTLEDIIKDAKNTHASPLQI